MCGSSRSKTVAVIGKRSVPPPLQNLHHRLLEKSIERSGDTELSHPSSVRLLDFHAPYRLRFIGPVQQLFPDGEPVLLIPSIPALPLLPFTRRNASKRFSRSHTSSMSRMVLAGLSGSCIALRDSVSSLPA